MMKAPLIPGTRPVGAAQLAVEHTSTNGLNSPPPGGDGPRPEDRRGGVRTRTYLLNNILTYRVAVGFLSRAAALQYNSPTTPVARCGTALSLRARRAAFARADVAKDLEDAHRRTRSSRVEGGRAVPSALVMRSSHVVRGNGTHVGQVRPALPPHTSALAHSARVRRHAAS